MRAAAILLLLTPVAKADNWPQWRGPYSSGVSSAKEAPTEWSAEKNIAWRTELPGPAGATPIVWGERLFLTTSAGEDLLLQAYATGDGAKLWEQRVSRSNETVRGDEGNYASPSPVTDGERVAALMGDGELACFTMAGESVWRINLQERYGRFRIQFGYTSSPVIYDGRLFVQMIHGDGDPETHEARIACLDLKTGDEVWVAQRVTGAEKECEHAYTSPLVIGSGADAELITHGADFVVAYDPTDGRELWRLGGMNPPGRYHPTLRFVASPGYGQTAGGEPLLVVPTAKGGMVSGVRPGGSGDVTGTDRVLWTLPRDTPDVPTPLALGGLVYLCSEAGVLTCVEADSGERVYKERIESDRYRASPVAADGKVYLTSRGGVVTVVRAGREFEVLAENDLGEPISSSPVITRGTIYLRSFDALYAIRDE